KIKQFAFVDATNIRSSLLSFAPSWRSGSSPPSDALGLTIVEICRRVPNGILCFFPSYTMMDKLIKRWNATEMSKQITDLKEVVLGTLSCPTRSSPSQKRSLDRPSNLYMLTVERVHTY